MGASRRPPPFYLSHLASSSTRASKAIVSAAINRTSALSATKKPVSSVADTFSHYNSYREAHSQAFANKENISHNIDITTITSLGVKHTATILSVPPGKLENDCKSTASSITPHANDSYQPYLPRPLASALAPASTYPDLDARPPQTTITAEMDVSQESTQTNDGRDYERAVEGDSLGDFHNDSLEKGDSGAVDFGLDTTANDNNTDGHGPEEAMSDPLSPIADLGLPLTRGNWRSVETPSQINSLGLRTTPFRRRPFGDPVTPKGNNNPFAHMNLQQSEMRPSQLFLASDSQLPSAIKMHSPTSSRPSPGDFNNSPIPMCQSSPTQLRKRASLSQPLDGFQSPLGVANGDYVVPGSPVETHRVLAPMRKHHSFLGARQTPQPQSLKRKAANMAAVSDNSDSESERLAARRNLAAQKRRKADRELDCISASNSVAAVAVAATDAGPESNVSSENTSDKPSSFPPTLLSAHTHVLAATEASIIPDSDEANTVIANSQLSAASGAVIKASVDVASRSASVPLASQRQKDLLHKEAVPETSPAPTRQSTNNAAPPSVSSLAENDTETADEGDNKEDTIVAPPSDPLKSKSPQRTLDSDDELLFSRLKLPLINPNMSTATRSLKSPTVSPLTSIGGHIPDTQIPPSSPSQRPTIIPREITESVPIGQDICLNIKDGMAPKASLESRNSGDENTDALVTTKPSKKTQATYSRRSLKPYPPRKTTPVPLPALSGQSVATDKAALTTSKPTRKRQKSLKQLDAEGVKSGNIAFHSETPEPAPTVTEDTPPRLPLKRPRGKANRIIETSEPPEDVKPSSSAASRLKRGSSAPRMRTISPAPSNRRLSTPLSDATEITSMPSSPIGRKKRSSVRSRTSLQQKCETLAKAQPKHKQKRKGSIRKNTVSRAVAPYSSEDELVQTPPAIKESEAGVPTPVTESHVARTIDMGSKKSSKGWVYVPIEQDRSSLFSNMVFALTFQSRELVSPAYEYERRVRINKDIEKKLVASGGRILEAGFEEMFQKSSAGSDIGGTGGLQIPLVLTAAAKNYGFTAVIADGYSRKVKYMQALALGIPCITYHWVEECIRKGAVVAWQPFLLTPGASICFDNAMMSRTLHPFPPTNTTLSTMIEHRLNFLSSHRILFVMKRSREEEKKRFYLFLMHVLGATVSRALSVTDARASLAEAEARNEAFDWVYIDEPTGSATELLDANGSARAGTKVKGGGARRKKRESTVDIESEAETALMAGLTKKLRLMSNELVVQSLIRGDLIDAETWESVKGNAGRGGGRKR
ncbi:radiation sensitive protein rad9 [Ceratocystis pirilliformis]|uniref:Radiation sensitive protein rad9 n=1 Tax=Ceratocystis pirilliformis TaxID=259994 RepID=A0ABR3YXJ4_9PEZI